MVHESFFGPNEQFSGLKCVICGEVIDPVILQNRELMKAGHVMLLTRERGAASEYIHAWRPIYRAEEGAGLSRFIDQGNLLFLTQWRRGDSNDNSTADHGPLKKIEVCMEVRLAEEIGWKRTPGEPHSRSAGVKTDPTWKGLTVQRFIPFFVGLPWNNVTVKFPWHALVTSLHSHRPKSHFEKFRHTPRRSTSSEVNGSSLSNFWEQAIFPGNCRNETVLKEPQGKAMARISVDIDKSLAPLNFITAFYSG
jgi:hypothetical protein